MKDYRIVYIKGESRVVEWVKKPCYCLNYPNNSCSKADIGDSCNCDDISSGYEKACESAIANGVPPADLKQVAEICWRQSVPFPDWFKPFIPVEGHPYGLEGYEVRVKGACQSDCCPVDGGCEHCASPISVAIITPKENETKC